MVVVFFWVIVVTCLSYHITGECKPFFYIKVNFFSGFAGFGSFVPVSAGFREMLLGKSLCDWLAVVSHAEWTASG